MIPKWLPILFLFAALSIAGCAGRVAQIEVPVAVPCKVPDVPKPAFAIDTIPPDADIFTVVRALWATMEQHEAYEIQMQAAIDACK
jgi:hypothetical protein